MLVSLPKCKINEDIDVDYENNSVCFALEYGTDSALCHIKAEIISEEFDVHQGGNFEDCRSIEFKYAHVSDTPVSVDQSDFDILEGQKIELTESQIADLNEKLKNEMVIA